VGIGFQHARLQLQRPTVAAEIADAAGWLQGMSRQLRRRAALSGELERRVAAALAAVGLDPALAGRSIEELSGGQQRRVAVAGLLARRAQVLVLDEPLAGLGGGADRFLRLIGFSLLFIVLSMVIAWTIDLGDLAPTLRRVGTPLHRLGLPVDEWAITAALAVRCLPLMLDECRTVLAARRQRQMRRRDPAQVTWAIIDVITASMAAAIRRASDLGEVIALRGGPTIPARPANRLHARDLAALVLVAAATAIPSIVA
jgi:energy-coupling factor transporter transmembrane protein EcfT